MYNSPLAMSWDAISLLNSTVPPPLILYPPTHPPASYRSSLFGTLGALQDVCHLSFSPDEKFLLGCGGDHLVYVWDTSTGELVTGKQYPEPSTLGEWTGVKLSGRRPIYEVGWVANVVKMAEKSRACLARADELQRPSQHFANRCC